jgi:hypothetical protein
LVLASLRAGISRRFTSANSPNADLNARIAASVIGSLSPHAFDSTGTMRSLWMVRVATAVTEAEGMIAELISAEAPKILLDDRRAHIDTDE